MFRKEDYAKMLTGEYEILKQQTADLTHQDSLLQPQPGGNSMNWVLGHLVDNLIQILKVLGGELPDGLPDLRHYGYGSEPVKGEEQGVLPLPELIDAYGTLTDQIISRLDQMTEEDFDEEMDFWQDKSRRGYIAFFYFFHNTYHLGQLEQLRNLAGKTEKVI